MTLLFFARVVELVDTQVSEDKNVFFSLFPDVSKNAFQRRNRQSDVSR